MKLDILAIAAHPDDVELSASGTLIKAKKQGKSIGVLDLTGGELGSRGTIETRKEEASAASAILGLDVRVNLGLEDGFFQNNKESQLKIIEQLRKFKPDVVLINAPYDRHPDHGKGGELAKDACFLSGLSKIQTVIDGQEQDAWRPRAVYHYLQDYFITPDIVIDITHEVDKKIESIKAYKTQFYDPNSTEPKTPISGEDFFEFLKGRWKGYGRLIGADYGEGFKVIRPIGIDDITSLI
ncbi:MAG: bacillithiol biosynthesis deacetylase BshB1 [Crocinitomicaceae bacterium]|nr:bacillithiol biosynthesis deacetylase BshB1 [Crocinitomicaceae bacterium]